MIIPPEHVHIYQEIFQIPGLLNGPVVLFGNPEVRISAFHFFGPPSLSFRHTIRRLKYHLMRLLRRHQYVRRLPPEYNAPDLAKLLARRGLRKIDVIDLFDPDASLRHDMNIPIPLAWHHRCHTLMDLGSLEHVFDTRICMENCLRMVKLGGFYFLLTCVKGYFGHGIHVFDPEALKEAIVLNGFEPVFERYTDNVGRYLETPEAADNSLLWLVARKSTELVAFRHPQQRIWLDYYGVAHGNSD